MTEDHKVELAALAERLRRIEDERE
ncbi:MAG: hypothetical protein JWQ86_2290, partial [Mycobacterium sp.]|nr:hypothetical protein [Mycobacterium sp.]